MANENPFAQFGGGVQPTAVAENPFAQFNVAPKQNAFAQFGASVDRGASEISTPPDYNADGTRFEAAQPTPVNPNADVAGGIDARNTVADQNMEQIRNFGSTMGQSAVRGVGQAVTGTYRLLDQIVGDLGQRAGVATAKALGIITPKQADQYKVMSDAGYRFTPITQGTQEAAKLAEISGKNIESLANEYHPNPAMANDTSTQIAGALGGLAPVLISPGTAGPVMAGQFGESTREQAIAGGDNAALANAKFNLGAAGGAAMSLVPGGRQAAGALERIATKIGGGAAIGAGQDLALQQAINPDRPVDTNSIKFNAIFGGLFGAAHALPDFASGGVKLQTADATLQQRAIEKTPEQISDMLAQEIKTVADPARKVELTDWKDRIDNFVSARDDRNASAEAAQKIAEQKQKAQEKAVADQQRALDQVNKAQADAVAAANEVPKSTEFLKAKGAEQSIAEKATKAGAEASPFALQGKLSEITGTPPPADPALQQISPEPAGASPAIEMTPRQQAAAIRAQKAGVAGAKFKAPMAEPEPIAPEATVSETKTSNEPTNEPAQSTATRPADGSADLGSDQTATPAQAATAPEVTPPQATPAPQNRFGDSPTGIRNSVTDAELEAAGFPAREPGVGMTDKEAMAGAVDRLKADSFAGQRLVAELKNNPRTVDGVDNALLAHEWNRLRIERDAAEKQLLDVQGSGDPVAEAKAKARIDEARTATSNVADVLKKSGTLSSNGLRLRQLMINRDYSLAAVEQRAKVAKNGEDLTPKDSAEIRDLTKKATATAKAVDDHQAKQNDAETASVFDRMIHEMKQERKATVKRGGSLLDFLHDQAAKANDRIMARNAAFAVAPEGGGRAKLILGQEAITDYAIVGAEYIARGIADLGKWSVEMVKRYSPAIEPHLKEIFDKSKQYHDANATAFKPEVSALDKAKANAAAGNNLKQSQVFEIAREKVNAGIEGLGPVMKAVHSDLEPLHPGLTERQVRDAYTNYGKTRFPSREADLTKLREYTSLGRLASAIEDANAGKAPPHTGYQPDKSTQAVREKMKELDKAMRDNGIETTDPKQQLASTNQARETALKNQIEDLQKQLKTGEKPEQAKPVADSSAVTELKATRDELKAKIKAIDDAKNGDANELARIKSQADALDKRIADLQAKVDAGDVSSKPSAVNRPASPAEIEVRKQKLAELNQQLADLRKGPEKTEAQLDADRLARYKVAIANRTQATLDRIKAGDASGSYAKEVRKPLVLDEESMKLKAANNAANDAIDAKIKALEDANRPGWMKAGDFFVGLRRFGLIFGFKTAGKLGVAGQARIGLTAADSVMGQALNRLPGIREFAKGAPREGGLTGKTLDNAIKGYVEGWKYTIDQAARVMRTGKTEAEISAGRKAYDPAFLNYLLNTHALLKLPAFAQEYHIALREITTHELQKGTDMTNPVNQIRVNNEAVAYGERAKFGQDNILTKRLNMILNSFENSKTNPNASKAVELGIRLMLPVAHIPTNFFVESATYSNLGLGLPRAIGKSFGPAIAEGYRGLKAGEGEAYNRAVDAFRKTVSEMSPEQKDSIMRHWKKGAIGFGLIALGFYQRNNIGGYYQPGKQPADGPEFGGMKIMGVNIPRYLIHLPIFEALHFGATIGHVMDHITKKTGESGTLADGVLAGVAGMLDELPYIGNARSVTKLLAPGGEGKAARIEMTKSFVVPKFMAEGAEYTDRDKPLFPMGLPLQGEPVKRKPDTYLQGIESGIPGLRQLVPAAPTPSPLAKIVEAHREQLGLQKTPPDAYKNIRAAIEGKDDAAAVAQITKLLDAMPKDRFDPNKVAGGFKQSIMQSATGSRAGDAKLQKILTPDETKTMQQEFARRGETLSHFNQLLGQAAAAHNKALPMRN